MCLLSRKTTGSSAPAQYLVAKQNLLLQQTTLPTPLPETLGFRLEAALGVPYFTALFHGAHARAGESVLVHWASRGVGLATCQIARAHGLKGTAGSEEGKKKLVLQNRAHEGFNHKEANYIDKIKTSVGDKDKGVDVIIEILAGDNLINDLKLLPYGGQAIVVGCRGPIEIKPKGHHGKRDKYNWSPSLHPPRRNFSSSQASSNQEWKRVG